MTSKGRRSSPSASAVGRTRFDPTSEVNEGDTYRGVAFLSFNGDASSFANSRNTNRARLPQRANTFPFAGPPAASYGGETSYTSPGITSIDAYGQPTTGENGSPGETNYISPGTASMDATGQETTGENSSPIPSTSRLPGQSGCTCAFPWRSTPPSNGAACPGPEHFKVRHLSHAEKYHLEKPLSDPYLQTMTFSRVFKEPLERLELWPRFFQTTEASGRELRKGFVTLWTTFILAVWKELEDLSESSQNNISKHNDGQESLLASVAIQPFVSNVGNLTGLQLEIYGLVWMLALIGDFVSLGVTALFLGYLHGSPAKLTYMWVCNIGAWIGAPAVRILLATFVSLVAIAYSSWVIYGKRLGIICTVVEVLVVIFAIATATALGKASGAAQALD